MKYDVQEDITMFFLKRGKLLVSGDICYSNSASFFCHVYVGVWNFDISPMDSVDVRVKSLPLSFPKASESADLQPLLFHFCTVVQPLAQR